MIRLRRQMPTDVRQGSPKPNSASPGFAEQSLGTSSQEGLLDLARRNEMMACASEESQAMGRLATHAHSLKRANFSVVQWHQLSFLFFNSGCLTKNGLPQKGSLFFRVYVDSLYVLRLPSLQV